MFYILDHRHRVLKADTGPAWKAWMETHLAIGDLLVAHSQTREARLKTYFYGAALGMTEETPPRPLLFETAIIDGMPRVMRLYPSWDEALIGHNTILQAIIWAEGKGLACADEDEEFLPYPYKN